jgi:CRISPR/Cas system-associated exonuclease Cas4 (RecB family)
LAIDALDALQRGSLVHEVLFLLLRELQQAGRLPMKAEHLAQSYQQLEAVLEEVAAHYREELLPAITRVWNDAIEEIRADLREWLRLSAEEGEGWVPWRFEYSFGLPPERSLELQDPESAPQPVQLDCGILLRGKIDLLEKNSAGLLRATDHKTGKAWTAEGTVIGGGKVLQPLFYALAAQKLFAHPVQSGRLYYCTSQGEFHQRVVTLDDEAQKAAEVVARTLERALQQGFFPAAPAEAECHYCDYRQLCGPDEERRVGRKDPTALEALRTLRGMR